MGKRIKTYGSLVEGQEKPKAERKRKRKYKKSNAALPAEGKVKLKKSDPDYYSKIGKLSAEARLKKQGTSYYSEIAKLSHPRADGYHGGRPKKKTTEQT